MVFYHPWLPQSRMPKMTLFPISANELRAGPVNRKARETASIQFEMFMQGL